MMKTLFTALLLLSAVSIAVAQDAPQSDNAKQPPAVDVEFQIIGKEYAARQLANSNFAESQKWYLKELNGFIDRYPRSQEAAKALL